MWSPFGRPDILREETIRKSGFVGIVDEKIIPKHNGEVHVSSYIRVAKNKRQLDDKVLDCLVPFLEPDDVVIIAKRKVSKYF